MSDTAGVAYNIFLVGFMGVGKSKISEVLCRLMDASGIEMDRMIAERENLSIADLFKLNGENYFRDLETALLKEIQTDRGIIVSCGGGVVVRPENVALMKASGFVVWLTASAQTIYDRVKDSRERPILNDNMRVEYIMELMGKRHELYQQAADLRVQTDNRTAEDIGQEIVRELSRLGK